jgi:tetratricopeptide (TPR) repeat protein
VRVLNSLVRASIKQNDMLDFKEQGNALYKEGDYLKAAAAYTKGLKSDPNNHVLYR